MLEKALTTLFLISIASVLDAQTDLESGFRNPPNSAKPHTWWHWINGNISKAGITADLEAMKKIGLGGAQIFNVEVGIPEGNTPFMTPQWKDALAHAFKEAKRLGIEICMHNCAGWSSSGGPWVKPEHAMQNLTWSETTVKGPAHFDAVLPKPESKQGYYKDVAVYAIKTPQNQGFRIPNIRAKASFDRGDRIAPSVLDGADGAAIPATDIKQLTLGYEGKLTWDVPEGDWTIVRMGHTPTGAVNAPSPTAGRGLEVDKMSRTAMNAFWEGMMATALKANGPITKVGLNNALIDSYEVGSQNWTPLFQEEFRKRRGYDPMEYLPAITGRVVGSSEITERFLWDWRRTVCDLFAENYFAYFKELCHKNGLLFSTEGYGNGSFDNLQVSGMADIPMGEFWVGGMAMESTKLAASSAHTNGKSVVGAESFTTDDSRGKWMVDPYSVKALGDKVFTLGINRYIFHRYTHQPWMNLEPGMTMGPWGMNLERTITWWNQGEEWMKYIARCQYLLQSGRFVADVVAFTGEEGPNDSPMLGGTIVPAGYDYDGCDATVLHRMKVENGQIVLPTGMRYRVLLLPESTWMTPKTARKIADLVSQGATVVGPRPTASPSLADLGRGDAEVKKIGDLVWGEINGKDVTSVTFGKGKVFSGVTLKEVLTTMDATPDFASQKPLNWIHRLVGDTDVYFVANPAYRSIGTTATFRVSGKQPEIWNPETGTTEVAPFWQTGKGTTTVQLQFDPAGSAFVVFRRASNPAKLVSLIWSGDPSQVKKPPVIEIVSASYEPVEGTGGADVTDKVKALVASGETEIAATNGNFGDPTVNRVKRMRLVYLLDGKRIEQTVAENGVAVIIPQAFDTAPPEYLLSDGKVQLFRKGNYVFTSASGRSLTTGSSLTTTNLTAPWTVTFPKEKGGPGSVRMANLASWTVSATPGVKYFSGTADYETSFLETTATAGGKRTWLDLGKVKNFAEVTLNGHAFPTLWKAPFRLDVTDWLKKGTNKLAVKVTNLWPNRLIGDEQYPTELKWNGGPVTEWPEWIKSGKPRPATKRVTFTTWQFYKKDSPLLESGLLGPVQLVKVPVIDLSTVKVP